VVKSVELEWLYVQHVWYQVPIELTVTVVLYEADTVDDYIQRIPVVVGTLPYSTTEYYCCNWFFNLTL
jgi:hypothetical protein